MLRHLSLEDFILASKVLRKGQKVKFFNYKGGDRYIFAKVLKVGTNGLADHLVVLDHGPRGSVGAHTWHIKDLIDLNLSTLD